MNQINLRCLNQVIEFLTTDEIYYMSIVTDSYWMSELHYTTDNSESIQKYQYIRKLNLQGNFIST